MKTKTAIFLPLLIIGALLFFASSCKKEEDNHDSSENGEGFTCGEDFTDIRDGSVYATVQIGNRCWMAENLRYLPEVVGSGTSSQIEPHYYVYGYEGADVAAAKDDSKYNTYGVLYNWSATQTACPDGWHVPSDDEWKQMTDFLGGAMLAGSKLKETGTTHWNSPNSDATNETGFTALPGGLRYISNAFVDIGNYGYWWSATENNTNSAWIRIMYYDIPHVFKDYQNKASGLSVRCVSND